MNEELKYKLATLPLAPGCYLMKNSKGTIIYVGKAKKLKNRVNQYFHGVHNYKTTKLVSNIADFEYVVTNSEKEALLLEINLIKKHRPRYNIMFMDDKSYPYLRLTKEKYPTLKIVRDLKKKKDATYFGPYPDVKAARETYKLLLELFPFRRCNNMPAKVCLYYHMNMCLGPCEYEITEQVYQEMVTGITDFLNGKTEQIVTDLIQKRDKAAEELEFENAARFQNLLNAINHVTDKQKIDNEGKKDLDVFAYYYDEGFISIQGLLMRNGQLIDRMLSVSELYDDPQETFESYILQYYQHNQLPSLVIVEDDTQLKNVLDCKAMVPIKGRYKQLLNLANENAKQQLEHQITVLSQKINKSNIATNELKRILGFDCNRIEMFDNSHLFGTNAVSGLVVFEDGVPMKNEYRHYLVHNANDDMRNMEEVVYRRYLRLLKEHKPFCDMLLVDGGYLQIQAALKSLAMLNIDIPVYGLVKDDAHRTSGLMNRDKEIIVIDARSEAFYYLTRIQDEVHGFAIRYHQKLRAKGQLQSILDNVEGIGLKRKNLVKRKYPSYKKLLEASQEDLETILPSNVANNLYQQLHEEVE